MVQGRNENHSVRETYSEDCQLFTLSGCTKGNEEVINGTAATLEIFPDRCLYPEDILWNGSDKLSAAHLTETDSHGNIPGIHSSHLIRKLFPFYVAAFFKKNPTSLSLAGAYYFYYLRRPCLRNNSKRFMKLHILKGTTRYWGCIT